MGMLNTITRAELAELLISLRRCRSDCDEVIATDSKCCMDKIAKHLKEPSLTVNDPHQPMLQAITTLLVAQARNAYETNPCEGQITYWNPW